MSTSAVFVFMETLRDFITPISPLTLNPDLAVRLQSADAAIIIQQIHYWCEKNREHNRNYYDGQYWTYNSFEQWQVQFPWISLRTLKTIFKKLEDGGYIKSGNFNQKKFDRTKWYALNYDCAIPALSSCKVRTMESERVAPPIPENTQRLQQRITEKESKVRNDAIAFSDEHEKSQKERDRENNRQRRAELKETFDIPSNRWAYDLVNAYVDNWYPQITNEPHKQLGEQYRMEYALVLLNCANETGLESEDIVCALKEAITSHDVDYPSIFWITTPPVLGYWLVKAGYDYDQIMYTNFDFNAETRGRI